MPTIAVILPTCNRFAMLQRTLRSLQAQTFTDFAVYVSDDASSDETKDHDGSSFPGLNLRWTRRAQRFPDIATHFSALYCEADQEWIALAHDDEVYAPEWLETLAGLMQTPAPSGKPVVMAQVGTVVVDARFGRVRFYKRRDQIPDGLYSGDELKRLCLFDGRYFPSNGFMVTRTAALQTGPFRIEYEQFDYEWFMRLSQLGVTACSTQLLHTYTMHRQNTVGSVSYLRRYFKQKNPAVMEREWLESLGELAAPVKAQRQQQLAAMGELSRFNTFLKTVAYCPPEQCHEILESVEKHDRFCPWRARVARLALLPVVFPLAALALRCLLALRARRAHASLIELDGQESGPIASAFARE